MWAIVDLKNNNKILFASFNKKRLERKQKRSYKHLFTSIERIKKEHVMKEGHVVTFRFHNKKCQGTIVGLEKGWVYPGGKRKYFKVLHAFVHPVNPKILKNWWPANKLSLIEN